MLKLHVIIASTRPGRGGLPVGKWAFEHAKEHGGFDVKLVDLAEVNLPFLDEPGHPKAQKYEHEHTKSWSSLVQEADAFLIVTPEYDYGMPATLLNAVHYLFNEWAYKVVGFVSYGGVSGGTRSVQMAKNVITSVNMMPVPVGVSIPFYTEHLKDGVFSPPDNQKKALKATLDEVAKWSGALKTVRDAK